MLPQAARRMRLLCLGASGGSMPSPKTEAAPTMLKIIAGIIVGWLVMAVLVIATFVITMMVMGLDKILKPDSYWTTDTFNIIVLVGGLVAAIVGGMVCKAIARTSTATLVLVAIVLIMGAGSAVMNMNKPDPPARPSGSGPPTMQQMMEHGKEPNWFAIMKTVLGAAGLVIGSSLVKGRRAAN